MSAVNVPSLIEWIKLHDCADVRQMADGSIRIASHASTTENGYPESITVIDYVRTVRDAKAILGY